MLDLLKVLDTAKYLVGTSDLFKSESIEVQNAWVDNISLQSSDHGDWSEFVQNPDKSSCDVLADEVVTKDKQQNCQNSISTVDEKDDSEVDERPRGVTDTLLQLRTRYS